MNQLAATFWNSEEQRVRAPWRLVAHTLTLLLLWLAVREPVTALIGMLALGSTWAWAISASAGAVVVAAATGLVGHWLDHRRLAEFGLRLDARWWADFGGGIGIGAVLMTGIFVTELGAGWLTISDRWVGAVAGQSFALALLAPLALFIVVAFAEELVFRGYWLRNVAEGLRDKRLDSRWTLALATMISSAVFGLAHGWNPNASWFSTVAIALAGCMLAVGVLWTRELGLPIGLHLSWNFCQGSVFGFAVSGNDAGPRVFVIEQSGPTWITGGEFGPEAGAIGLVAMVAGVGLTAGWIKLTRGRFDAWE